MSTYLQLREFDIIAEEGIIDLLRNNLQLRNKFTVNDIAKDL